MKVKVRAKPTVAEPVDLRYVLMRFGDLIIDPRTCPAGIMSFAHYHRTPTSTGPVNTECGCPKTGES